MFKAHYLFLIFLIIFGFWSCTNNVTPIVQKTSTVKKIQTVVTKDLFGVDFFDSNHGFAVGDSGTILKTTDGGNNWTNLNSGIINTLYSVKMYNNDTIVCGGDRVIMVSYNGGTTWDTTNLFIYKLMNLSFKSSNNWVAVGAGNINAENLFYYSSDYGLTWTPRTARHLLGFISCYLPLDSLNGLAAQFFPDFELTLISYILKTNNNDSLFYNVYGNSEAFYFLTTFDRVHIFASGIGRLYSSSDAGDTWSQYTVPSPVDTVFYFSIHALSNTNIYTCGSSGIILNSTDGGQSWNQINSGTNVPLKSITSPKNSNFVVAVGYSGTIIKISF